MTKNNFSEKLKELRLKNKYTQKFVAKFLGLTQRQYQYCEMGHIPSQFDVVIKMCRLYGIDANELFGIDKINAYPYISDFSQKEVVELLEKYDFGKIAKEMLEKGVRCPSISEGLVDFNLSNEEKNNDT